MVNGYTIPILFDVQSVLWHSASLVESMESVSLDSDESLSSDSSGSGSCVGRVGHVWQTA